VLFDAAGLDLEQFTPTEPTLLPPVYADTRAAWEGTLVNYGNRPVRIEAAAYRGRPVYFEKVVPSHRYWSVEKEQSPLEEMPIPRGVQIGFFVSLLGVYALALVGFILLALRSLALGRGDRKGALRLAIAVVVLRLLHWLLTGHHVAAVDEILLLCIALSGAVSLGLLTWLLYIGIEPYVRRFWPQPMVAWSRFLAGQLRDPLVGRHLLVGLSFGVLGQISGSLLFMLAQALGLIAPLTGHKFFALMGGRYALGGLFGACLTALAMAIFSMLFFLLCRIVLRRTWLAAACYGLIISTLLACNFAFISAVPNQLLGGLLVGALLGLIRVMFQVTIMLRYGLFAWIFFELVDQIFLTLDFSSPYFNASLISLVFLIALAIYAFRISLAGHPLFRES
jgi:hypothetical protein